MATDRSVKVRLNADPSGFIAGFRAAQTVVKDLRRDIDTTNDRTAWLAQSFLALGPTLGPISAAAVPALAGIATQMAVTGLAAGTLVIAFNGVGDALKALNDYQVDPTEAHLKKMHQTMALIGPTGRDLVRDLDKMRDGFIELSFLTRDKMFPGVIDGLHEMGDLFPRVQQIVAKTAAELGNLASEGGEALSGPRFEGFFRFLEAEGVPTLEAMARTIGNFADGLGAMFAAFAPLSRDFSNGMLEMSRSFAAWAHGLQESSSFQEFIDYVRENTPHVLGLIRQLAGTFIDIVEAAAPVGEVMIPLLTGILDVVQALVDTPLGPIFIAAAAAMSVYGRAVALASITTGGLAGRTLRAITGYDKLKDALKVTQAELVATDAQTVVLGASMSAAAIKAEILGAKASAAGARLTSALSVASAKSAFLGESVVLSASRADKAISAASTRAVILGDDLRSIALKDSTSASVKAQIMFEARLAATDVQARKLATDLTVVGAKAETLTYAGRPVRAFGADLSATEKVADRSSRTVGKLGSAFAGSAGSIGLFALAMSPLPEKIGATNAAYGAMIGTFAGPGGAAIGGAIGGLIDLSKAYVQAATSTREFTNDITGLAGTLDQQTGAITKNTEAFVENELAKQGVIAAARNIGISSDLLVDAYLGDELAIYRVNEALNTVNRAFYDSDGRLIVSADKLDDYRGSLELVDSALGAGRVALDGARDGLLLVGEPLDTTAEKFRHVTEKVDLFKESLDDLDARLEKRSHFRSYQAAIDDLAHSLRDNKLFGDGIAFDTSGTKGRENQNNLDAFVQAIRDVSAEMEGVERKQFLRNAMQQFDRLAGIAGLSKERTRELKRELGLLDLVHATPTVKVGNLELSQQKVDSLERGLRNLDGLTARPKIILGLARDTGADYGKGPGFDQGGWTGNAPVHAVAGYVHGQEFVVPAPYAQRDRSELEARYLKGYRDGGYVDPARMVSVNVAGHGFDYDRMGAAVAANSRGGALFAGNLNVHGDRSMDRTVKSLVAAKGGV